MNKANYHSGRVEPDTAEALPSASLAGVSPNQTEVIRTKPDLLKVKQRAEVRSQRSEARPKVQRPLRLRDFVSFVCVCGNPAPRILGTVSAPVFGASFCETPAN